MAWEILLLLAKLGCVLYILCRIRSVMQAPFVSLTLLSLLYLRRQRVLSKETRYLYDIALK
jgi:hypothetical protein